MSAKNRVKRGQIPSRRPSGNADGMVAAAMLILLSAASGLHLPGDV
ncbi:hypothetical protein NHH03_20030 [Stieleria sp. TO1_6]|nr:hypothetical protein [Stieleria tagensis]MCO8124044.1 hypothetical protein [Stieleria tagensis]